MFSNLEELVKFFEGLALLSYRKQGDIWTIGWGHTRGVSANQTCTQDQAQTWLTQDLLIAKSQLRAYSPRITPPGMEDALTDFVFNEGIGKYMSSTLMKKVNSEAWGDVPTELRRWVYGDGVVMPGLVKRREAEIELFASGGLFGATEQKPLD